mgnify:CR=1 FL=1
MLVGSASMAQEPALPAGLAPAVPASPEPALPAGLDTLKPREPVLPAGLDAPAALSEPVLPAGLGAPDAESRLAAPRERLLPAGVAVRSDQLGSAVEARLFMGMAVARLCLFAARRLDSPRDQRPLRQVSDSFDIVHDPVLGVTLAGGAVAEKKRPRSLRGAASLVISLRGFQPS